MIFLLVVFLFLILITHIIGFCPICGESLRTCNDTRGNCDCFKEELQKELYTGYTFLTPDGKVENYGPQVEKTKKGAWMLAGDHWWYEQNMPAIEEMKYSCQTSARRAGYKVVKVKVILDDE